MSSSVIEQGRSDLPLAVAPGPVPLDGLAIRTEALTKRFGDTDVVENLDLEVPSGTVFGFLGPNGSGKTTTIRMLLGLIEPTRGSVHLLGREVPDEIGRALPHVGALVEGPAWYPWLSGRDNLARMDAVVAGGRRANRRRRVDRALERVGLIAAADKKYRAYSLGMRQRLGLANTLLHPRELLVLDEPTNGMDPQGTREIRHLIRQLSAEGATVFLSTHLLSEVEQICTHVAIMNLGRLVAQGPLESLRSAIAPAVRVETVDLALATQTFQASGLHPVTAEAAVLADLDGRAPEELCKMLVEAGVRVSGFVVERPSLEDTFVALTGEGFDVPR